MVSKSLLYIYICSEFSCAPRFLTIIELSLEKDHMTAENPSLRNCEFKSLIPAHLDYMVFSSLFLYTSSSPLSLFIYIYIYGFLLEQTTYAVIYRLNVCTLKKCNSMLYIYETHAVQKRCLRELASLLREHKFIIIRPLIEECHLNGKGSHTL